MKRLAFFILPLIIYSCSNKAETEEGQILEYTILKANGDKPQAPIDLDIRFESTPYIGKSAKIIYSATPQIDAQDFEMKITLPDGVQHDNGKCEWKGGIVKEHKKEQSIHCTIPDNKKREIIVIATITEGKAKLTKVLSMMVGSEEKPQKGVRKKNARGENIIELNPDGKK